MKLVHGKNHLLIVMTGLALFLLGAPALFSDFYVDLVTKMMIFGIALLGYDIIAGYTGLVSLGHAMFLGLGGYCAAFTMKAFSTNLFPLLGVALVCALIVGFIVGYFSIQTKGIFFVFLTLAFAQFFYLAAFNLTTITGGDNGITLPKVTIGIPNLWETVVPRPQGFYYLALGFLVLAYLLCRRVISSPFGKLLVAIRENEERVGFLGFNARWLKIKAFMISAFLGVTAGVLFATYQDFVSPGMLHWTLSGDFIMMSILGGMGTLVGPVLGGAILLYVGDLLSSLTENWMIFIGSFFVLTILFAPQGILGLLYKMKGK
ncbi:MAG: branched-chain amino acid ABC transporter permease [Thermodesulfobacteriota bacterium]|jgi:branched-chain amino acid transport system permease protein